MLFVGGRWGYLVGILGIIWDDGGIGRNDIVYFLFWEFVNNFIFIICYSVIKFFFVLINDGSRFWRVRLK